ncbi:MAG: GGDEF domain-containing protein [Pleurocapsa sp. SU_196_0]|nr:GGDEF domain-containing protein [Pleurocapsa sp. SU_196_0]
MPKSCGSLRSGDVRGADALVLGREIEVFERTSTALQSVAAAVNLQVTRLNLERRGADSAAYRQLLTFSAGVAISLALMLILSALNFQQRTRLIQRLSWQARTDGLTGVLNRRAWDESYPLALARARRAGQRLSVVMLDLDRFKVFNDAYGHAAGDKLLRMTAQCLQRGTRMTDIVARYGGGGIRARAGRLHRRGRAIIAGTHQDATPRGSHLQRRHRGNRRRRTPRHHPRASRSRPVRR